jgi:hypothetical protein
VIEGAGDNGTAARGTVVDGANVVVLVVAGAGVVGAAVEGAEIDADVGTVSTVAGSENGKAVEVVVAIDVILGFVVLEACLVDRGPTTASTTARATTAVAATIMDTI